MDSRGPAGGDLRCRYAFLPAAAHGHSADVRSVARSRSFFDHDHQARLSNRAADFLRRLPVGVELRMEPERGPLGTGMVLQSIHLATPLYDRPGSFSLEQNRTGKTAMGTPVVAGRDWIPGDHHAHCLAAQSVRTDADGAILLHLAGRQ